MHQLDPVGTRETVKRALEEGSKEVRVAAIECLGTEADDLPYLLTQAKARSKEVRAAALISLARVDAMEAINALKKELTTDNVAFPVIVAIQKCEHPSLLQHLTDEAEREFSTVFSTTDEKIVTASTKSFARIAELLESAARRCDGTSCTRSLFATSTSTSE